MEELLEVVRLGRHSQTDEARTQLLSLFTLAASDPALVSEYRRKLASRAALAMQRTLITIGIAVLVAGLLWPWLSKLGLGRLPGDFRIQTGNSVFYFPLATCLLVSVCCRSFSGCCAAEQRTGTDLFSAPDRLANPSRHGSAENTICPRLGESATAASACSQPSAARPLRSRSRRPRSSRSSAPRRSAASSIPDRIAANVQTASAAELREQGALDLADFMKRSMGSVFVNDAQSNPLQPDVQYRGFVGSPLLGLPQGLAVYQDGVRINEPFGDTVSWALIPESAIDSLYLVPGSNPLFGLNALGGAIAVRTKDGFDSRRQRAPS